MDAVRLDRRPRPAGARSRPRNGWWTRARRSRRSSTRRPRRLRDANVALAALEAGVREKQVEAELPMHPYAAKMLVRRLEGASASSFARPRCAIADLEWWTRGGSEYPDDVALTLAVRRAAGAGAGAG